MGILDGLLGMFGGQQQQPQGGLLGSNSLYGDLFTQQQQQALQNRASQGGLLSLANSGALDYTVPFISGKVPGGFAKGLAAYAGGMGEGEEKGVQSALAARLTGLKGTELQSDLEIRRFLMKLLGLGGGNTGGAPNTGGPPITPPGGGSLLPQPASDTAPRAGGALAGAMGSDNPGSLAMAEPSDIQEAVAKKLATTDGLQHWAGIDPKTGSPWNPKIRAAFQEAGLPVSGPISEEMWARAKPLIFQYESMGGQNVPNYRFDATHTAGGPFQITNSTWRNIGGPEIAASMRGSGGGAADTVAPQVTGTGAPITQAQLGGQPGLLPQPAPQAVPPITMPQQPAMPQPGAGLKLGNLDLSNPQNVLALGALADMAKLPSLATLATGTPGYQGMIAGERKRNETPYDLLRDSVKADLDRRNALAQQGMTLDARGNVVPIGGFNAATAGTAEAKAFGTKSGERPFSLEQKYYDAVVGNAAESNKPVMARPGESVNINPNRVPIPPPSFLSSGNLQGAAAPPAAPQQFAQAGPQAGGAPALAPAAPGMDIQGPDISAHDFSRELGTKSAASFVTRKDAAEAASDQIVGNNQARELLDSPGGVITGPMADYKLFFGRILGGKDEKEAVANTEAFVSQRASAMRSLLKAFGSGSGVSDTDVRYAEKIAGGQIALTEASIRKILDDNDKLARYAIEKHNKDAALVEAKTKIPYSLTVEMPEAYKPRGSAAQGQSPEQQPPKIRNLNGKHYFSFDGGKTWFAQ